MTNPNWFDADFKTIKAVVKPDGSNLVLGQGITNNAKFGRYQRSDFTFDVNMK